MLYLITFLIVEIINEDTLNNSNYIGYREHEEGALASNNIFPNGITLYIPTIT